MQNTSLSYFSTSFLLFNLVFNEVTTLSTSLLTWLPRFKRGNHILDLVIDEVTSFYASLTTRLPRFMPRSMPRCLVMPRSMLYLLKIPRF